MNGMRRLAVMVSGIWVALCSVVGFGGFVFGVITVALIWGTWWVVQGFKADRQRRDIASPKRVPLPQLPPDVAPPPPSVSTWRENATGILALVGLGSLLIVGMMKGVEKLGYQPPESIIGVATDSVSTFLFWAAMVSFGLVWLLDKSGPNVAEDDASPDDVEKPGTEPDRDWRSRPYSDSSESSRKG